MWPNSQETAAWSHLVKNSLIKNFFCAVAYTIIFLSNKQKKKVFVNPLTPSVHYKVMYT